MMASSIHHVRRIRGLLTGSCAPCHRVPAHNVPSWFTPQASECLYNCKSLLGYRAYCDVTLVQTKLHVMNTRRSRPCESYIMRHFSQITSEHSSAILFTFDTSPRHFYFVTFVNLLRCMVGITLPLCDYPHVKVPQTRPSRSQRDWLSSPDCMAPIISCSFNQILVPDLRRSRRASVESVGARNNVGGQR